MSFASEIKRLERIAAAPAKIPALAAPAIAKAVDREFATGTAPDGGAWAALAQRTLSKGRFPPPLTETGTTKNSVTVTAEGSAIRVSVGGESDWHQHGTGIMPARPILPEDGILPASWEKAIASATKRALPEGTI